MIFGEMGKRTWSKLLTARLGRVSEKHEVKAMDTLIDMGHTIGFNMSYFVEECFHSLSRCLGWD